MTIGEKHPGLIVHTTSPLNAGPPPALALTDRVTPNALFFVRNHASVPEIDPARYRLSIEGLVERPATLSLESLEDLPQVTREVTLACAGNRRKELIAIGEIPGEVPWGDEAIGNAVWRGVRLRDVLDRAGVRSDARHVELLGADRVEKPGGPVAFGGSISIEAARSGDVVLAHEMNGAPLGATHGFPLRAVVPGHIGAKSVKWLERIVLREDPSDNPFQTHAYRLFPPHVLAAAADWSKAAPLGELPVNAAIVRPLAGNELPPGPIDVLGWALTGGDRSVARVEVSFDGGAGWIDAELDTLVPHAWRLFRATGVLEAGRHTILARAHDDAGNVQPENARRRWNIKGYVNNAQPYVIITVG